MTDDTLLADALTARGEAFLAVEERAAAGGPDEASRLAQAAREAEGFERLVAEVLLVRLEEDGGPRQEILDFMRQTEEEMAPQAVNEPPPQWGAGRLLELFGEEVTPLLAVYAAKLDAIWPYWRVASLILYLQHVADAAAMAGLVKLVATTPLEPFRDLAADALLEIGDPRILEFIEEELAAAEEGGPQGDESEGAQALRRVAESLRGFA